MKAAAGALGLPYSRLRSWKAQGLPGFPSSGRVIASELIPAVLAVKDGESLESIEEAERRKAIAAANREERRDLEESRELIRREEVESLLREWIGPLAEQLRTQPDRLAQHVNPADSTHAKDVLRREREELFRIAKEVVKK